MRFQNKFVLGPGGMAAALVIFAGLALPAGAQTNLILNGSFEAPSVGAGVVEQTTPLDWVSTGTSDYVVANGSSANFLPATDGSQLFYFFPGLTTEVVSQGAIGLSAGQTYQFSFDLSKMTNQSIGTVIATFGDGTDSQTQSFSVGTNAWSSESWSFTAADTGAYTLTLQPGADSYPAMDRLALSDYSAVPEPPGWGLAAGLGALVAAVFFRRAAGNGRP
jgi:hypothetical protein